MQVRTQIVAKQRRYDMKDMFVIDLAYLEEEGEVFASHRSLPVHGYGSDEGKSLDASCEAFDFQWRHLVEVPEESLTDGGAGADPGFAFGMRSILCFECAIRRGGEYDAGAEQWTMPPDLTALEQEAAET